ncbi:MAG: undecaprenyl diphosphate synthase family protein, partial [Pelagibacteraceae bacterium]|nr:undecaprenyl diphosphate synthase family protein [Pelagibacteraceae bacterium]
MDGNGRWALQKGKSRNYGHQCGLEVIEKIVDYSIKKKISYLTLFTFSSENWKRPKKEVNFLFKLLENYFKKNLLKVIRNGIKV